MESMSASTGFQKSSLIPKQLLPVIKPRWFTAKTAETQESVLVSVQKKKCSEEDPSFLRFLSKHGPEDII